MLGGFTEVGVAAKLTLATGGAGAVIGWPLLAHGFDNVIAGGYSVIYGRPRNSLTVQALEKAGASPRAAELISEGIGVAGTAGGSLILRGGKAVTRQGTRQVASTATEAHRLAV